MSLISWKFTYNFLSYIGQILYLQEHKCVLDSCRALEAEGFDITYLPVQTNGIIDMEVCWILILALIPQIHDLFALYQKINKLKADSKL